MQDEQHYVILIQSQEDCRKLYEVKECHWVFSEIVQMMEVYNYWHYPRDYFTKTDEGFEIVSFEKLALLKIVD